MSTLEAISRQVSAGIDGCKWFPGGGLRFTRLGFEARVDFTEGMTDLLFDTRDLAVEAIYVAPAGFWHGVRDILGIKDTQIGDEAFDAHFEVRASSEEFARRVLSPALRPVLRSASMFGDFMWRLSRAGFLLRVYKRPRAARELERWLMLAFQLLEAIPGSDGKGRVQIGAAIVRMDEKSECQICGATLARGATVRCARCATPHHRDCWEFNGRCAIFACGETKFR